MICSLRLYMGCTLSCMATDAQHLDTWLCMSFLCKGYMAHALVVWICSEVRPIRDVIKVLDAVSMRHLPAGCTADEQLDSHSLCV